MIGHLRLCRITMPVVVGKHSIPIWVLGAILISFCAGAFAVYTILTLRIPFEVTEPLEVMNYPQAINLYPGENVTLNIIILNHASQQYMVFLNFSLDNSNLDGFVTFSQEDYAVIPGSQTLTAWVTVAPGAPSANTMLSVYITRWESSFMGTEQVKIQTLTWAGPNTGFSLLVTNSGTKDLAISQIQVNYGTTGVGQPSSLPLSLKTGDSATFVVTFAYTDGTAYDISVVTSSGYKFTDNFRGGEDKV